MCTLAYALLVINSSTFPNSGNPAAVRKRLLGAYSATAGDSTFFLTLGVLRRCRCRPQPKCAAHIWSLACGRDVARSLRSLRDADPWRVWRLRRHRKNVGPREGRVDATTLGLNTGRHLVALHGVRSAVACSSGIPPSLVIPTAATLQKNISAAAILVYDFTLLPIFFSCLHASVPLLNFFGGCETCLNHNSFQRAPVLRDIRRADPRDMPRSLRHIAR